MTFIHYANLKSIDTYIWTWVSQWVMIWMFLVHKDQCKFWIWSQFVHPKWAKLIIRVTFRDGEYLFGEGLGFRGLFTKSCIGNRGIPPTELKPPYILRTDTLLVLNNYCNKLIYENKNFLQTNYWKIEDLMKRLSMI